MEHAEALKILQCLADGCDPFTGELFPDDSLYNRDPVVRALAVGVEALQHAIHSQKQKDALPGQAGKPWSPEENLRLLLPSTLAGILRKLPKPINTPAAP